MYKVTVDDREVDQTQFRTDADALGKQKGITYNQIPQELQGAANNNAKGSLPGKYQIPSTSDIEKEVKAQSKVLEYEVKVYSNKDLSFDLVVRSPRARRRFLTFSLSSGTLEAPT